MTQGASRKLRPDLEPLVKTLVALPADDRAVVLAMVEAETRPAPRLTPIPWEALDAMTGVVNFGGNALEDCDRLYDGEVNVGKAERDG